MILRRQFRGKEVEFCVDDADWNWLSQYDWIIVKRCGKLYVFNKRLNLTMGRFIIKKYKNLEESDIVFYKNKNRLDNRLENLGIKNRSENLVGQQINSFTVIENTNKLKKRKHIWAARCECGNIVEKTGTELKKNKSCGCKRNELISQSKWTGHEGISGVMWASLKRGAQIRKLEFSITIEDIWEKFVRQNGKCAISGLELHFPTRTTTHDGTASLDRIDSSLGYIKNNVQWVHKDINFMKQAYNQNEFIQMCKIIAKYNE